MKKVFLAVFFTVSLLHAAPITDVNYRPKQSLVKMGIVGNIDDKLTMMGQMFFWWAPTKYLDLTVDGLAFMDNDETSRGDSYELPRISLNFVALDGVNGRLEAGMSILNTTNDIMLRKISSSSELRLSPYMRYLAKRFSITVAPYATSTGVIDNSGTKIDSKQVSFGISALYQVIAFNRYAANLGVDYTFGSIKGIESETDTQLWKESNHTVGMSLNNKFALTSTSLLELIVAGYYSSLDSKILPNVILNYGISF